jgi:hypothetical protein
VLRRQELPRRNARFAGDRELRVAPAGPWSFKAFIVVPGKKEIAVLVKCSTAVMFDVCRD